MSARRDEELMRRALMLAERGWGQTAPNPMVGAVVVRDGEIVGEGWHERYGAAHAEINALRAAGASAESATMYVTLEPCNHWGKTPPCVDALIAARIARVVIATLDPGVESGGGAARLREHGIAVDIGACEGDARELNAPFFFAHAAKRPWVTLKLAVSIDGAITDAERSSAFLTNEASRAAVHRMRANVDAIAVGAGTYLADAPALTARGEIAPRVAPLRVVLDPESLVGGVRTTVREPAENILLVEGVDIAAGIASLGAHGVRSLLVEGGAGIASALLDADLVDRLVIFQAPIILGAGALHAFSSATPRKVRETRRFPIVRTARFGDDTMTIYALHAV